MATTIRVLAAHKGRVEVYEISGWEHSRDGYIGCLSLQGGVNMLVLTDQDFSPEPPYQLIPSARVESFQRCLNG